MFQNYVELWYMVHYSIISQIYKLKCLSNRVQLADGKWNQGIVSTAKRLASLFWYLIASTIDTLHNTINGCEIACIWYLKYNVHVCIYDPNKCWFYISKNYCFCFLLTLNCENLAKQLLPLAMSVRFVLCTICLTRYFVP